MSLKSIPSEPYCVTGAGIIKTRMILIITGVYIGMHSEADIKELIAQWRAASGVDDPITETFVQWVTRLWRREKVKKQGEIHCLLELDKDQMVYTAHFH